MKISKTSEFKEWFEKETNKSQIQILNRLKMIKDSEFFGDCKKLGSHLSELRWKNGRRIYFTIYEEKGLLVLLLLGGYKNAQIKDIKKARRLIEKYTSAKKERI